MCPRNLLNQALVNAHLKSVPSLRTFTTGCLSRRDSKVLGRQADWSLDAEILTFSTIDEFSANLLKGFDVSRSQSDADFVDFLLVRSVPPLSSNIRYTDWAIAEILFSLLIRHCQLYASIKTRGRVT
jgi:hypothetical protein